MAARMFLSTKKGLFIAEAARSKWTIGAPAFRGVNVTLALPDARDRSVYAALNHGHFGVKLHRSSDGGTTWEEIPAPKYPEPPADAEPEINPMTKAPIPWALQLIWALEAGGKDEPGVLWCGTLPGGLFKSTDRGQTWELNRPLWDDPRRKKWFGGGMDVAGIHSICVDPRNSKNVAVGVSCGGVWVTEDGGNTWEVRGTGMRAAYMPPEEAHDPVIQDPHMVVQCPTNPDALWVQHHNGIFRSTDRGRQWNELNGVNPSSFGFAVAVSPRDPDTAWFVPAEKDEMRLPVGGAVVVNRTRDGGRTFDTLTKGLPVKDAYDIVYRHALDISRDGKWLAFGSTTGSAWASKEAGDSWKCLSNNLPPVNAVRFAK